MNDSTIRYQYNPALVDSTGFFDYCIPLSNESLPPVADSVRKYYDFSIFDYITPPPPQKQYLRTTSLFSPHYLTPKHTENIAINRQSTDWITIVFVICLFILAWVQTLYSKRLRQIFRAAAQPHFVNQLEREGNLFRERISLGLGFVYYAVSSIFIYQFFKVFVGYGVPGVSNVIFTAIIFTSLFLYETVRMLLVYALGIIFRTKEFARLYQLNILIFNQIIGVVLFPVSLMAIYWNSMAFVWAGIIIISLMLFYRFFRGFLTGLANKDYNLLYLFLYLCTLEILPLLLIFKVISRI
jgi:hypothetical protein